MNFEAAFDSELKTIAAFENRVYPLASREANGKKGVPYLIYSSSEGLPSKTLDGYQSSRTVEGEINVVAERYADMKNLTVDVLRLIVSMERRVIGTDGPFIQELKYEEPVEIYEEAPKLYRCLIDYEVYL